MLVFLGDDEEEEEEDDAEHGWRTLVIYDQMTDGGDLLLSFLFGIVSDSNCMIERDLLKACNGFLIIH